MEMKEKEMKDGYKQSHKVVISSFNRPARQQVKLRPRTHAYPQMGGFLKEERPLAYLKAFL
jgi:hypothetical protein